ncbi:MAG: Gfo/Idh/MocA family oxidoreductase [Thermoleophilaceae bacterium]|jgi:predicted dehydrogenase
MRRFQRDLNAGNGNGANGGNGNGGANGHFPLPNGNGCPTRTPVFGEVRVAVVGLGYWGPNLLRSLIEMSGVKVKYICDLDEDRLGRYARRYPGTIATRRYEDILEDPDVHAVVIATPVFTHHELALRALRAGKHTMVEKPLAPSLSAAEELRQIADEQRLVLMCGHTFLYSPPVRAVKEILDRQELGEIYFISASRVNLGLHQRDVSVVWDLGPHDFSILLYWLEEFPEWVRAVGRDSVVKGIPDVAFIDMVFPSGILANVELSWLAPSKLRRTVVVGSEKMVVYDDGAAEPVRVFDHGVVYKDPETFGQYHLSYRTGDIVSPKLDTVEPISLELADFVDCIRDGVSPAPFIELAQNVVRLIESAESSIAEPASAMAQPGVATV